jgi:hypothetical protein
MWLSNSWWDITIAGTQIFKNICDQQILSCRQTYMGDKTIMRRLLGEYGSKTRGYGRVLITLACKTAWC